MEIIITKYIMPLYTGCVIGQHDKRQKTISSLHPLTKCTSVFGHSQSTLLTKSINWSQMMSFGFVLILWAIFGSWKFGERKLERKNEKERLKIFLMAWLFVEMLGERNQGFWVVHFLIASSFLKKTKEKMFQQFLFSFSLVYAPFLENVLRKKVLRKWYSSVQIFYKNKSNMNKTCRKI